MPFGRRDLRNAGCICGNDLAENRVKANEKAIFPLDKEGTVQPGSKLIDPMLGAYCHRDFLSGIGSNDCSVSRVVVN